jgi:hypothetical protein
MTIQIRRVTLSPGASEQLAELAAKEQLDPDVYSSLMLENAIR